MTESSPRQRPQDDRFSFEGLDVYQRAIDFLALSAQLASSVPKGSSAITEQLRPAALSIPTNIAEATGRLTKADQRRHYGIARGSAMECAAILGACERLGVGEAATLRGGRVLLLRIVSMLTRMCR